MSTYSILVAADWWDRAARDVQRRQADGMACQHCGAVFEIPVPMLQRRSIDAVDLVIGLPATSAANLDREWIAATVRLLRPYISSPTVVSVRTAWWSAVDELPLAPALTGLSDPPELPEPPEERRAWLESTKASLTLPDIPGAVARFVAATTVPAARRVVDGEPALLEPRWLPTIELTGDRLQAMQETDEQREVLTIRLSRLRQIVTALEQDTTGDKLPAPARRAVDEAVATPSASPGYVPALESAVDALRPLGPGRLLGASLTSLLASRMAHPSRSPADGPALRRLADEAVAVCRDVFGDSHQTTISNVMNSLLLEQEAPELTVDGLRRICERYASLAGDDSVRRAGHLVDILNNLATALEGRGDVSRGERQEQMLQLFKDVEHIARLTQPWDTRTVVLALVNQAAVLRQRLTGAGQTNAKQARDRLLRAQEIDEQHNVLHTVERVQLRTNMLNASYRLYVLDPAHIDIGDLLLAARGTADAAAQLHADSDTAIGALINAGAVLVDVYTNAVRFGQRAPELLDEATRLLSEATARADRVYPVGHRTRLTATLNLAAVYGSPNGNGGVVDASEATRLLTQVATDAADRSLDHEATAQRNLGTLRAGLGEWEAAAHAFDAAWRARRQLISQTSGRHTRLGEVIASGDLVAREALAFARLGRAGEVISTLEGARATLLRHRHGDTATIEPSEILESTLQPGRTVVYLGSCDIGSFGLVISAGQPDRLFIDSLAGGVISAALRRLVVAPTRLMRLLAFDDVARTLAGLIDTTSAFIPATTTQLCVVACGPLAGAPLHAIAGTQPAWAQRWPVRFWPSASLAYRRGEPRIGAVRQAVAVADPTGDLPLAATEIDALQAAVTKVASAPAGWSTTAWLRHALPQADLAHFACHGRTDLINPTGSHFKLGAHEQLSVDDLLDGPDLTNLQLVIASACQAGVPASEAPDELLGIAYGLVHAGARSAITTLWEISDAPAALLVARLYAEMAEGLHPANALHRAQNWLAAVDNAQLADLCQRRLDHPATVSWLPVDLAVTLAPHTAAADPSEHPFQHPADWGAFTYLGG